MLLFAGRNNFNLTFPPVYNLTDQVRSLAPPQSTHKVLAFSNNYARSTEVKSFPTGRCAFLDTDL